MSKYIFYNNRIRLHCIWSLIFSFLLIGCVEKNKHSHQEVIIQWKDNKAEAILISQQLFPGLTENSLNSQIEVQLKHTNVPVIGDYIRRGEVITFQPLIPFTRGLQYEVYYKKQVVSQFEIPLDTLSKAPTVVAIYPTSDTVPENLLKIYIQFSQPMQEGEAIKNITILKNDTDTVPSIFLDLENELWNKERTLLTLWLDPGRIKRDLQPNKRSGTPLQKATRYAVLIGKDWRSAEGMALESSYRKTFFAGTRDAVSPDPSAWSIITPNAKTNQPLTIHLQETLDHVLLKNTVRIINSMGNIIAGVIETAEEETILRFTPVELWKPGNYIIEIESRLEDLAGNNLNRLFDNDITRSAKTTPKEVHSISFTIQ
ncbi:hypothetical protein CAP36_08610 [Chitinophagaceae bacterium IBVUCB2]|nr:hypothetical protein CAP36_08610 [Chitinophagaceae bacterium IBVUCB2]